MGGVISTLLSVDTICPILSYVGGEAKYIWGLRGNLDDLQTQMEDLIAKKQDLLNKVELAKQQPRTRPTNTVEQWFKWVEGKEAEVESLQQERDREIGSLCLGGFCSKDLISSYDFGKKVEKLKEEVIKLREKGEAIKEPFEEVPDGAAVALAVDRTIVGQEAILAKVWGCITDQEKKVGIIGLYGTGGVGKTTLLKQVNNKFCTDEQHDFDAVIWSVVSREPNLEQIQEDIGNRIGFSKKSWEDKSFKERARDITNTLSRKKFALLLDDIWESKLDLTNLGVPLQRLHFGSKIVFTTRFHGICGEMGADERFPVSYLGDDDAWELFQGVVGRYVLGKHPDIPELAKTVASECHGLPLALKTVGRVMSRKEYPEEWRSSIQTISESASKFEDMEEKVLSRLKFSYDSLPRDELRSCLLFCCLYPEDFKISKTELIEFWKSEGFLDSTSSGWDVVGALVRACLLEEGGDRVKMHDMIREMALWIANKIEKEEENFLVRAGVRLTDAPKIEEWEGVKRISLMDSEFESLPQIPHCPSLQTLLLNRNDIEEITDSFFQSLPSLRVLDLSGNYSLTELPVGISTLVSLRHLDLSFTDLCGLPQELKALVNLRYLNLENTRNMSRIPQQLISSFPKLQVLRMLRCGVDQRLIIEEGNVLSVDAESLMKEIHCLEQLNLISLSLRSSRGVENFLKFPKLLNITQALYIEDRKSLPLNFLHLANMEHLEKLQIGNSNLEEWNIDRAGEVQKVLQSGVFRNLQGVFIIGCSNVKDLTWLVFFPKLKFLAINDCDDMEEIFSVEKLSEVSEMMGELNLFAKLEFLELRNAKNLKRIYHDPLPFPQLKEIWIDGCPKLKKLLLNSSSTKERKIVIWGDKEWWEELQWEDQATQNAFSPCFLPEE